MSPKLVSVQPRPVNDELVEFLTDQLHRAQRGEISAALVFAVGNQERTISHGCAGSFDHAEMVYNLEAWKHRLLQKDFPE